MSESEARWERIDRAIEFLAQSQAAHEAKHDVALGKIEASVAALHADISSLTESVRGLLEVAKNHERRIERLEGGDPQ
jgi:hypothetical protein